MTGRHNNDPEQETGVRRTTARVPPVRRRTLATALAVSLVLAGCGIQDETPSPEPVDESPNPLETAAPPVSDESRIELPETDFTDPESVAASFWVAWESYDGEADTDETYVERYRPLVTDRFLDEYEAEGIPVPPQNLTAFRESGRLRTAEVGSVEVPEPAQESDHQIVLTVEGNLTDADGGEEVGPRESSRTMLLNNAGGDDPDWRVDRFVQQ